MGSDTGFTCTHVAITQSTSADYPVHAPFHPAEAFPEYAYDVVGGEPNVVYAAVRSCFARAGLDKENFGTPAWNPLKGLINPGDKVLLKPNLVKEQHPHDQDGWRYVLTHGSVVRAAADYVWKALEGRGTIVVADAPQADSSFEQMVRTLGLDVIRDFYTARGLGFELIDLRREEWENRDGVIIRRRGLLGDPAGNIAYDLGRNSEFVDHRGSGSYYGADYDDRVVNYHHSDGRHEYLIAASAINCDVVFSLPKLKTHKKAGVTVSLKNLVGINGDKNWLPHHTEGNPANGGDEHPTRSLKHRTERIAVQNLRKVALKAPVFGPWLLRKARRAGTRVFGDTEQVIRSGNWWGNDTVWRMCLDLNKIVFYGRPDGTMRPPMPGQRKRHYVLVDGIIAGQGQGPMTPDPMPAGLVVFGLHPFTVDAACACVMGFDPDRIPILRQAPASRHYPICEWTWRAIEVVSNRGEWNGQLSDIPVSATLHFEPHFGWKGYIERQVLEL